MSKEGEKVKHGSHVGNETSADMAGAFSTPKGNAIAVPKAPVHRAHQDEDHKEGLPVGQHGMSPRGRR